MTAVEPESTAPPVQRTGRRWGLLAIILFVLLLVPGSWLARRAASKMEFFHLRSVAVEGTRYLTPEAVLRQLAVDTLRSVWDDTEPLAAKLRTMSQVATVRITRKLPGTLVVTIGENLPVAFSPSPRGLEAVDSTGAVLPIDPTSADLDLPIAAQRDRLILSLLGTARAQSPALFRRISEIERDGRDGLVISLSSDENQTAPTAGDSLRLKSAAPIAKSLRIRALLGVSVTRLADIFPVESDLLRRRANVAELDLRYRDQVIARLQ